MQNKKGAISKNNKTQHKKFVICIIDLSNIHFFKVNDKKKLEKTVRYLQN